MRRHRRVAFNVSFKSWASRHSNEPRSSTIISKRIWHRHPCHSIHITTVSSYLLLSSGCNFPANLSLTRQDQSCVLKFRPKSLVVEHHSAHRYRILSVKNARAWVSIDFTYGEYSSPRTIEKMNILGAILELPAKQNCRSSPFTSKLGQIGSAV